MLERNWHCPAGEIDLICARGTLLVVCEVKARTGIRPRPSSRGGDRSEAAPAAPSRRHLPAATGETLGRGPLRRGRRAGRDPRGRRRCVLRRRGLGSVPMETLIVERKDGVVTVTMNRPERKNAANGKMLTELRAIFEEVEDNPDDRIMVLTGAGGAFCSGADLSDPNGPATDPVPLRPGAHAAPRGRGPRPAPRVEADDRQGGRVRRRRRPFAGAGLRPHRLQRPGQALHDLRQAWAGAGQRGVLAVATARGPRPGQGDRALRGHVERRGGGGHRPGEQGFARRRARRLRGRLGHDPCRPARPWLCR